MGPIFIGGAGRSGTTLLASMLGGAAETIVTPESQFKVEVGRHFSATAAFEPARALAAIEASWRFRIWDCALTTSERAEVVATRSFAELLTRLVGVYAARCDRPAAGVWIDHTPENIRFVPLLSQWFPDARFVHIVRDGRALLASGKRLDWQRPGADGSARWWGFILGLGFAAETFLPPERVTRIHYETLVEAPEATLRRLCERLELEFSPAMLRSDGFAVPSYTQTQHRHVGKPPDPNRLTAWQQELTPRQIEVFEASSFELLTMLGYTPLYGAAARPATTAERLGDMFAAGWRQVGLARRWRRARAAWLSSAARRTPARSVGEDAR